MNAQSQDPGAVGTKYGRWEIIDPGKPYVWNGNIKMLEVATELLSSILGLHKQDVISDLYELSGSDIMKESYDAVVRRYNPNYVPIPTITEQAVSNVVTKLKEGGDC